MSVVINTKVKIPSEKETKIKILGLAQIYGCYPEAKKAFYKFEQYSSAYRPDDVNAKFQIAAGFIKTLSEISIHLVAWLADENGNIMINNVVAFTVEDVPNKE